MSSDLTPEQDAATRQMMLVGDLPARVLGPMREMLKDLGVVVVDSEPTESLLERLRQFRMPSTPPLQPPPLPPMPGLDTETQPNREMRRRAEKNRRRRGVR